MNEPKLRFKGFEGEWEKKKLGEFGYVSMCKRIFKNQTSTMGDVPFYKIGTFGGVPDAYISKSLYEEYKRLYSFPQKGDILLSAAGTIGRTVEYDGEDAYFQDSNIVWLNHDERLDNRFLKYLYSIITWSSLEGATIKRLYNSNILESKCRIPSLPEQRRIASYFTHLDTLIEASRQKVEKLKQVKAASMQSFFPTHGQRTPKIRFKGCEGEWKECLVADKCVVSNGKSNTQDQTSDGQYPFFIRSENVAKSSKYLYDCEAVITIGEGNIGKVFHYINGKFDLHQRCYKITDFKDIDGKYFYYYFSSHFYDRVMRMSAKATVDSVRMDMITEMPILYPTLSEQRKIATYFTHLDTLLTLERQRYAKLQQVKRASLTQMFA